jgi:hypothetical protein
MNFKRNPSFIVVNIGNMVSVKDHINVVIKKIKKEQSRFQSIKNYYYSLFSYFLKLFSMEYYDCFILNKIEFNNSIIDTITFYIFDHSVQFYGKTNKGIFSLKIPYEYIIEFGHENNQFCFTFFGKINDSMEYEFSESRTIISFESSYILSIFKLIKLNMNYHILYNKISNNIIEYYCPKHD